MAVSRYQSEGNGAPFVTYTGETTKPMCCVKCWVFAVAMPTTAVM